MDKLDWRKALKYLYAPKAGTVTEVDVPAMRFAMIDGEGDPNGSDTFAAAVGALYSVSYTLKFDRKKAGVADWAVFPLEGLWSAPDMDVFTTDHADKSSWMWTLMIAQPDPVDAEVFEKGRAAALAKDPSPALEQVRFEEYREGPSVQIMHVGPFATEGPDVAALHERIGQLGAHPSGRHHEIYLSDPRKGDPDKAKTVIRQPYALD